MADIAAPPPSSSSPSTPPAPSKPSSSSKAPISLKTLLTWTPLYLTHRTPTHLNTLSKILSTPHGTDRLLLLLGYSTLLTSRILTNISLYRLHLLSTLLIEKAVSLPPNTVVLLEGHIPTSRTLLLAGRLKALSALVGDFRIFVRLWGLLGIWRWGVGVWGGEGGDVVEQRILKAQVLVNVMFQALENGAYLSSKGVMGWSEQTQNRAWAWSSRFWAAHVGLEFLRLGRVFAVKRSRAGGEKKEKGVLVVDEEEDEKKWLDGWKRELLVNAAWAPLTLHWSTEGGLISDFWVGVFGSVAGVVGTRKVWRDASGSV